MAECITFVQNKFLNNTQGHRVMPSCSGDYAMGTTQYPLPPQKNIIYEHDDHDLGAEADKYLHKLKLLTLVQEKR